ncbi:MAG: hypothetical protein ABIK89_02875, partial [Planctomycetota bacterium]
LVGNFLLSLFFGLAAIVCVTKPDRSLGVWYGLLAIVWISLAARAGIVRRKLKKERLAELDRTVETVRRAFGRQDLNENASNNCVNRSGESGGI